MLSRESGKQNGKSWFTNLILGGDLGNNLGDSALEILNTDVLKYNSALKQQSHICGHFLALWDRNNLHKAVWNGNASHN